MKSDYMTVQQLFDDYGLWPSLGSLRTAVSRGKVPHRKIGGKLVFIRSEIEQWLDDAPGLKLSDMKSSGSSRQ
ncbi:MAG: helix-turn-helix domain-containing protein [Pirellulales bacterium]|nr:helix-turn-helix domain-containing protein [Pirellulales bacterium]